MTKRLYTCDDIWHPSLATDRSDAARIWQSLGQTKEGLARRFQPVTLDILEVRK